jgi:indolepyruvate ferredoxin oxidoreductase alpha subunit
MAIKALNGDQAMAYGAVAGSVSLVTSYPGSPGTGTVETLIQLAEENDIYVEWSANEKVAMEIAIGASIAGRRALVCVKSVGMNAMVDPLMALNLTPVNGGLVILLGDDPGAYGSQNDQDSRPLAQVLEMPMMEPASPDEACAMMATAFDLSENYRTAVIIRETRSFTCQTEDVSLPGPPSAKKHRRLVREPFRFVPVPGNAVKKHEQLHERLARFSRWGNDSSFNQIRGTGKYGVVGAGHVYTKLIDVLGAECPDDLRLFKLGVLYPLPEKRLSGFIADCHTLLVLEENEPYVETRLRALTQSCGYFLNILGKESGHVSREGELYRWQIETTLENVIPGFVPERSYLAENAAEEIPAKESHCGDCGYDAVLDALDAAARNLGMEPVITVDPGCLVTIAHRIDAKYAMGSAVGVADGISKSGAGERAVAIFGDSSFFHTSLPAICNAVHNQSDIVMVVVDNQATAATGFQPNPGVSRNAAGREAPALDMEQIARACGVPRVCSVAAEEGKRKLEEAFRNVLQQPELALIIIKMNDVRKS